MNGKKHGKHGKRAPKLNPKADRGSQHRKIAVGKSKIGAKRITLLPGFLINGFTSGTTKKTESRNTQRTKEHLLTENLHAFLEQKGTLRRSQRILRKNKHEINSSINSKSTNNSSNHSPTVNRQSVITNGSPNQCLNSLSVKSILKKNSKSVFKEITDKFAKAQKRNVFDDEPKGKVNQFDENNIINYFDHGEDNDDDIQTHLPPKNLRQLALSYNRGICKNFADKIRVNFKKNAVEGCLEIIHKEINMVNLMLQGKAQRKEVILDNAAEDDSDSDENKAGPLRPVPVRNWVYSTPKNQKPRAREPEECRLQVGAICANKNRRNLYAIRSKSNVEVSDEGVMVDKIFFKRVATAKNTPSNFGRHKEAEGPWDTFFEAETRKQHLSRGTNMKCPVKATMPILASYLENTIPIPAISQRRISNISDDIDQDFTIIEEENHFEIQECQPFRGNKRQLNSAGGEKKYNNIHRRNFNLEPTRCAEPKMFDFASQEKNMFDFGVI